MNDEVLKRLDAIGAKLASLGTQGFDVIVRQAVIDGALDILWAVAWFAVAWYVFAKVYPDRCAAHKQVRQQARQQAAAGNFAASLREIDTAMLKGCTVLGGGLAAVFGMVSLTAGIRMLSNPHFYAIEKLVGMVK